jgi:hypothetical protein
MDSWTLESEAAFDAYVEALVEVTAILTATESQYLILE